MELKREYLGYGITALILGSLSSGFWEIFLRPCWYWMQNGFVSIIFSISLGYKIATYETIAKGFDQTPSIFTNLVLLNGGIGVFWGIVITRMFIKKTELLFSLDIKETESYLGRIRTKIAELKSEIIKGDKAIDLINKIETEADVSYLKQAEADLHDAASSIETIEAELYEYSSKSDEISSKYEAVDRRIRLLAFICIFFFMMISVWAILTTSTQSYANSSITRFNQCLNICKPYLSNEKEELVLSRFAQIGSKDDFVNVMKILYETAEKNGVKYPKFDPI